jgi:signal transduction histidine kinase
MEEFIYTISHDLKSPLVSILGFINLIHAEHKDAFPEDFNYYIERIEKNIEQMGKLITDILEYSKIGRILEEKEVYSLNEIINDVIGRFQPRLKESNISINVEKRLPYIYIVKKRFTQVFENLIDNAIKYMGNEKEKKEINIGLKDKKGDNVTVFVQDTGIGIKKEYFPKLFQLFSRIPSHLDEEVSGSGIGLANVKKIIETHGGSIWLESEEGKGTIFYFDIPLPPT